MSLYLMLLLSNKCSLLICAYACFNMPFNINISSFSALGQTLNTMHTTLTCIMLMIYLILKKISLNHCKCTFLVKAIESTYYKVNKMSKSYYMNSVIVYFISFYFFPSPSPAIIYAITQIFKLLN